MPKKDNVIILPYVIIEISIHNINLLIYINVDILNKIFEKVKHVGRHLRLNKFHVQLYRRRD